MVQRAVHKSLQKLVRVYFGSEEFPKRCMGYGVWGMGDGGCDRDTKGFVFPSVGLPLELSATSTTEER